jgi:hypothetical protein
VDVAVDHLDLEMLLVGQELPVEVVVVAVGLLDQ